MVASGLTVTVPSVGQVVTWLVVRVLAASLAGPGVSLVSTATLVEPSSATVARSLTATGGSLTSVTVTATSAVEQRTRSGARRVGLGWTFQVKAAGPMELAGGVAGWVPSGFA